MKFLCGALGLLMLVPARMPACAQSRSEGLGGVAGLKVESYLQLRYTNDTAMGDYGSLCRAKAMITWDPGARLRIYGQLLYKSGNRATNDGRLWVQELWVRYRLGSGFLSLGQLKPPFGMERFTSDAALDTIDRSQPTDHLIPNGGLPRSFARDIGILWEGASAIRGSPLHSASSRAMAHYRNRIPAMAHSSPAAPCIAGDFLGRTGCSLARQAPRAGIGTLTLAELSPVRSRGAPIIFAGETRVGALKERRMWGGGAFDRNI